MTFEGGFDRLARNVGAQVPVYGASHIPEERMSFTRRQPEIRTLVTSDDLD